MWQQRVYKSRFRSSWRWWAAIASAACVARLGAVADWWRSLPMAITRLRVANTLACLCSCQWWTFWTYLVTVNLYSLYLMNFMFRTTHDAMGNILRVHYENMKCNVSLPKGSVCTLFRWGGRVFHVCEKMFFLLTAVQHYINQTTFSRVMITNVLLRFLWITVYTHISYQNAADVTRACQVQD